MNSLKERRFDEKRGTKSTSAGNHIEDQIYPFKKVGSVKRDSSFVLFCCDKTSLRNYSPLIHSRFICSLLKHQKRFVLMMETCKTKLGNKILKIEAVLTASSQVVYQKDLCMWGTGFTLTGKISTLEGHKVKN